MSAYQRRIRRQGAESTGMTDSTADGRDYLVSYFLNPYQRGSMVMRFASEPGTLELMRELQKYGLDPTKLKDVTATRVADVKDQGARYAQAQQASESARTHSRSLQTRQTASAQPNGNWADTRLRTMGGRKRRGVGPLLLVLVAFYGIMVSMASESFDEGVTDGAFGGSRDTCATALEARAEAGVSVYGEGPGFFDDRVSTSFLHPASVAYLLGCASS